MKGAKDTQGGEPPAGEGVLAQEARATGPRRRDSRTELAPGTEVGRFTIVRKVGAGGMGVVFLARDRELDREVALKLLRNDPAEQQTARAQRRMLREARAMAAVSHPNLVVIYEAGVYLDHVFLAMEYIEGHPLGDWLAQQERSLEQVVGVFEQVGSALAALHEKGIVHRDFKPDNVLVDADGHATLLDLGIARRIVLPDEVKSSAVEFAEAKRTGTDLGSLSESLSEGALVGTPAYMAPEQLLGGDVGPAADQFSFGIALYEALHGQSPFSGGTELETISATIAGEVRPRDQETADVPDQLHAITERMLRGEPEARYPSMSAAIGALRGSLGPRRQLRFLTDRWLRHGRKREVLLADEELLGKAESLLAKGAEDLDDDVVTYLRESFRRVSSQKMQRRALLGTVAALSVGLVPALYLLRRRTRELEAETRARVANTLDTVAAQVDGVFADSAETLRLMVAQRSVWMDDVERLLVDGTPGDRSLTARLVQGIRALDRYFQPAIGHSPTISSLMVCTETFELLAFEDVGARQLERPYGFYNRLVNTAAFGDAAFQLFDGEEAEWLEVGDVDRRGQRWSGYDPADRIFYRRAARAPAIGWTEPYLFFVTKEVGITGSQRFEHEGRSFVLAVDVTLTDLSQITTGIAVPGVQAVVLTRGDEVVGLPRAEERRSREELVSDFARYDAHREGDEAATLPRLADLGHDQLTEAWAQVRDAGRGVHECAVGDTSLCVGVRPIGREEQDLTLLVVAERR